MEYLPQHWPLSLKYICNSSQRDQFFFFSISAMILFSVFQPGEVREEHKNCELGGHCMYVHIEYMGLACVCHVGFCVVCTCVWSEHGVSVSVYVM